MKLIKADGKSERELLSSIRARSAETDLEVSRTVTEIIEAVRAGGDAAVLDYTERFDGVRPDPLELDPPCSTGPASGLRANFLTRWAAPRRTSGIFTRGSAGRALSLPGRTAPLWVRG